MPLERINYPQLAPPVGPYVHGVKHNRTLYISGLTAFGSPSQNGTQSQQAEAIFDQVSVILDQEKIGLDQLIKVTVFVTHLGDMVHLRQTLMDIYGDHKPASSLVKVDQLFSPELSIEIEAIFALPE